MLWFLIGYLMVVLYVVIVNNDFYYGYIMDYEQEDPRLQTLQRCFVGIIVSTVFAAIWPLLFFPIVGKLIRMRRDSQ